MSLLVVICLQIFLIRSLLKADGFWFAFCTTSIILGYDIYFVHIEQYLPKTFIWILKSWQEIILGFAIVKIWKSGIKPNVAIYILLFLSIYGICIGMINESTPIQILKGLRMYLILPFAFYLLLISGHFKNIPISNIIVPFIFFTSLSIFYSIIQDFNFVGNLKILWFYDFVNEINPIQIARFNYIREDRLRASGLFISPLIQSALLGFSCLILTLAFTIGNNYFRPRILGFLLGLHVYGLLLCRTRIGIILFTSGLILSYSHFYIPILRYWMSVALPLGLILTTILLLNFGFSHDLSALGRITQYKFLFSNFRWLGFGFGDLQTLTYFDSMYISSGLVFGILSFLYIGIPFWACYKLYRERCHYMNTSSFDSILYAATFGFCFSLLYMFAFQFTLGTPTLQIFYLLILAFLSSKPYFQKSTAF